ncbi:Uncharacterised protein [Klebsiella oxytoca]|nr:Uncharacterised protein [Klebsiella oxytoca]
MVQNSIMLLKRRSVKSEQRTFKVDDGKLIQDKA